MFTKSETAPTAPHAFRGIYENENGVLYYWTASKGWIISAHGDDNNNCGFLYAKGDVACPTLATGLKSGQKTYTYTPSPIPTKS